MEKKVLDRMRQMTHHKHVKILPRGNAALFVAFYIIKQISEQPRLLIPDQGGWISFKTYPELLRIDFRELTTDKGVINLKELEKQLKIGASALVITSFAGYFAEQPLKKISALCKKYNCLLIEDASGAIGDKKLCNGKYSDIIVGSFGKWKPVNLGYGGFISTNKKEILDKANRAFSLFKTSEDIYYRLLPFLNSDRLKKFIRISSQIKKDLSKFNIYHGDKRGLNVVVGYDERVLQYCQDNGYFYILCPNYIRLNEKAISIEVKRL